MLTHLSGEITQHDPDAFGDFLLSHPSIVGADMNYNCLLMTSVFPPGKDLGGALPAFLSSAAYKVPRTKLILVLALTLLHA